MITKKKERAINMNQCWICGSTNLTDEHKLKSADLRRNYGKKYKDGKVALQYFSGKSKGIDLIIKMITLNFLIVFVKNVTTI